MNLRNKALICCDALSFLERLPSKAVTLTYLDPPWCTSFDLANQEEYELYLSKVIQQIRRILVENCSLFVQWSQKSHIDIRLIINQAFNRVPIYEITWHKRTHTPPAITKGLQIDNDIILVYSISNNPICNKLYRALPPEKASLYNRKDESGLYKTTTLLGPSYHPTLQFTWRGYQPPPQKSWLFAFDKLETLFQENRIHFPSHQGMPQLKQYLDNNLGVEIGMTWDDIPSSVEAYERTKHIGQMPLLLIERILQIGSNPGDQVLDPFCGSGTTLVAAQSLNRYWWGADNSSKSIQITIERLLKTHNLEANKDYEAHNDNDILQHPAIPFLYKKVVLKVGAIAELKQHLEMRLAEIAKLNDENTKLQQSIIELKQYLEKSLAEIAMLKNENTILQESVTALSDSIIRLKKLMNLGENNDEETIEDAIRNMEDWIALSIKDRLASRDNYISAVCSWLTTERWGQLELPSQSFLPEAELLFDIIEQTPCEDFSPFIIQYCRALENELLTKLFQAYTDDLHGRPADMDKLLIKDKPNEPKDSKNSKPYKKYKTQMSVWDLSESLRKRDCKYTLGNMPITMARLRADGSALKDSELLQDLRNFTIRYFEEHILEQTFLHKIEEINKDFRCKAAHPYILDIDAAQKCREQVRGCLNELILNYRGKPETTYQI